MIKVFVNKEEIKDIFFDYPNGEFGIKNLPNGEIEIEWVVENLYKEITKLIFIQKIKSRIIKLKIDYFPFSRDDKYLANNQNQLPLAIVFKDLLYGFSIELPEQHSVGDILLDTTLGNIKVNRSKFINFINRNVNLSNPLLIIYPDESSYKRYSEFFNTEDHITFNKTRNKDGKIIKSEINEEKSNYNIETIYNVVLIDDICSFGNSFIKAIYLLDDLGIMVTDKILFTYYDENQEKSEEFKTLINKHYYLKTINFKGEK